MIQKLTTTNTDTLQQELLLDDLWARSSATAPSLRFACAQTWQHTFARDCELILPRATTTSRWTAAIPLIECTQWKVFRAFELPSNPWMQCGDLLVDGETANDQTYADLADEIRRLPAEFVRLEGIFETPELLRLIAALQDRRCTVFRQTNFVTGMVRIADSWDEYLSARTKGHRKHMRRSLRQLQRVGPVKFERIARFSSQQRLRDLLDEALAIEHRGWKGNAGTSLDSNETCRNFYIQLCQELARKNMLELLFLNVGGQRVAFEIGFNAKGTWHSHKVGFDPEFARYGPGQLLFWLQLQHWHETREVDLVDTVGVLSPAVAKWCNESRQRYRYLISIGGRSSGMLVNGFRGIKPLLRRFRSG
ncbi:MAG: GNAT family N-acetyltransferase [Pirellulaceae bacterium]